MGDGANGQAHDAVARELLRACGIPARQSSEIKAHVSRSQSGGASRELEGGAGFGGLDLLDGKDDYLLQEHVGETVYRGHRVRDHSSDAEGIPGQGVYLRAFV